MGEDDEKDPVYHPSMQLFVDDESIFLFLCSLIKTLRKKNKCLLFLCTVDFYSEGEWLHGERHGQFRIDSLGEISFLEGTYARGHIQGRVRLQLSCGSWLLGKITFSDYYF